MSQAPRVCDVAALEFQSARGQAQSKTSRRFGWLILATIPAGTTPMKLLSAFALNTPGQTVGYKVYVVVTTGNERGSEAVYVTRPV